MSNTSPDQYPTSAEQVEQNQFHKPTGDGVLIPFPNSQPESVSRDMPLSPGKEAYRGRVNELAEGKNRDLNAAKDKETQAILFKRVFDTICLVPGLLEATIQQAADPQYFRTQLEEITNEVNGIHANHDSELIFAQQELDAHHMSSNSEDGTSPNRSGIDPFRPDYTDLNGKLAADPQRELVMPNDFLDPETASTGFSSDEHLKIAVALNARGRRKNRGLHTKKGLRAIQEQSGGTTTDSSGAPKGILPGEYSSQTTDSSEESKKIKTDVVSEGESETPNLQHRAQQLSLELVAGVKKFFAKRSSISEGTENNDKTTKERTTSTELSRKDGVATNIIAEKLIALLNSHEEEVNGNAS